MASDIQSSVGMDERRESLAAQPRHTAENIKCLRTLTSCPLRREAADPDLSRRPALERTLSWAISGFAVTHQPAFESRLGAQLVVKLYLHSAANLSEVMHDNWVSK